MGAERAPTAQGSFWNAGPGEGSGDRREELALAFRLASLLSARWTSVFSGEWRMKMGQCPGMTPD